MLNRNQTAVICGFLQTLSWMVFLGLASFCNAEPLDRHRTYCNPLDLAYRFELIEPSFREAADPMVLVVDGEYWLFASKSGGYWHSRDLLNWSFVAASGFNLEDWAPTVWQQNGHFYMLTGTSAVLYTTDDLASGKWKEAGKMTGGNADPAVMVDDDGRVYFSWDASSTKPIFLSELDPAHGYKFINTVPVPGTRDKEHRGWEVEGDQNELLDKKSWIEGSWLNKFNGKYYLQYSAAGTQYKSYADGVLVSDHPMGPYVFQNYSPFSMKPTGFIAGAGHSCTFAGLDGKLWHISTLSVSERMGFERRFGLFPAALLPDGQLTTDTYLGDYPHYIDGTRGLAGWMLLSRARHATASSSLDKHPPELAVDEEVRTWWSAATGDPGEWFQIDLGADKNVQAVQINFADEGSTRHGRSPEVYRYRLLGSDDGKNWTSLIDHSKEGRDAPHDYEVLPEPVLTRYVKLENVYSPNGAKFSLYDLRVFGSGGGKAPSPVQHWSAKRDPADLRHATIQWDAVPDADFYIVRLGNQQSCLNLNYQVYGKTTLEVRSLNTDQSYFVTVDAVNENGITAGETALPIH